MDVGLPIPNIQRPSGVDAMLQIATAAEGLGFHSIWLADHVVRPLGGGGIADTDLYLEDLYEPLVTAGWLAGRTDHIRIGFGVLVLPYRNPVITAKMLSSLDRISGGRLIVGVAPGYWTAEYEALGIPRTDTGAKTSEYMRFFRHVWTTREPSFEGQFVSLRDTIFRPLPSQSSIPLWVGGASDAALERAVTLGDGWHWHSDYDGVAPLIERLRRLADRERRDLNDGFTISNRPVLRFADDVIEGQTGIGGRNAAIVGPPDYLISEVRRMEDDLGVTHLVPDLHEDEPLPAVLEAMHRFREEVLPHV